MDNLAEILQAAAALAWPIIVVIVLVLFRSSLKALVDSARSRKFTVRVAGNELTMEEISEQQVSYITDLQKQMVELQQKVEILAAGGRMATRDVPMAAESAPRAVPDRVRRILWVDDEPRNNAFLIQGLEEQEIEIVTALDTKAAMMAFNRSRFDRVITDLGRTEGSRFNPRAGIELAQQIRLVDADVPIFIFTSPRGAREYRQLAIEAGATDVTASPTSLLRMLKLNADAGSG